MRRIWWGGAAAGDQRERKNWVGRSSKIEIQYEEDRPPLQSVEILSLLAKIRVKGSILPLLHNSYHLHPLYFRLTERTDG